MRISRDLFNFQVIVRLSAIALGAALLFFPGRLIAAASENPTPITVEFYWGEGCPHCAKIEPLISDLADKYETVVFNRYEIYKNADNAQRLMKKFEDYDVPDSQRGVPIVFLGTDFMVGDEVIAADLEAAIVKTLDGNEVNQNVNTAAPEKENNNSKLTVWTIMGAALVDSINPCAIAVLLVLFSGLMMSPKPGRMLRAALAFISAIYLAYLLFGFGIVYTIHLGGLTAWMPRIVGMIAIIIGLANLKDFFWYGGGGFVMEIPRRWRPKMITLIDHVTSPLGAFLAGLAVTLFELPCTGGPYFFVLGLLAEQTAWATIVPILLFYNLLFISPLILLTILITRGFASTEKVTVWKDHNLRRLHLVAGLIMIALGIWVLF